MGDTYTDVYTVNLLNRYYEGERGVPGIYVDVRDAIRYIMLWVPGHSCVHLQRGEDGTATEQLQNFHTFTERQLAVCLIYS